jgi:predicted PurR-regulated permease PerM
VNQPPVRDQTIARPDAAPVAGSEPSGAFPGRPSAQPQASPAPCDDTLPLPRRGFLERDWQRACHVVLTLLGSLALLWTLWQILSPISRILVLFLLSAVLAFVLAGPVEALAARVGRRFVAVIAVYVLVGVVVIGGLALLARPFIGQATSLLNDLPRYAGELENRAPELENALGGFGVQASIDEVKTRVVQAVEQGGAELLRHLVGTLGEVGGLLADALLALVISFYLILDGPRLRQRARALVPVTQRDKLLFVENNVARVLGGYLRGQLVMAATIGVLAGVGCALLGLPYAVVLGVLAALFELVPMFGPILSAAPAVLIALFLPFPTVLWVLLFFFAVQQIESNILGPRITGHAVGLHPLGALFALLVGFQLAGIIGGLFAVPVAGILWVLIAAAYRNVVDPASPPPSRRFPGFRRAAPRPTPTEPGPALVVGGKSDS